MRSPTGSNNGITTFHFDPRFTKRGHSDANRRRERLERNSQDRRRAGFGDRSLSSERVCR